MSTEYKREKLEALKRLLYEYEREYYLIRTSPKEMYSQKRFYEVELIINLIKLEIEDLKSQIKLLKKDIGLDRLIFEICRS